jgi:transcriptional regulator with XRE-family HTH domain
LLPLGVTKHFDDEGLMTEGDSPTIARRSVRLALREARERAGLTQNQVAEEMEWSHSKVIRIENGDVSISQNDLRPLLGFLGIKDKAVIADLVAAARVSRTRQQAWYQVAETRDTLTDGMRILISLDASVTNNASFDLLQLGQGEVLYRETGLNDEMIEDREAIAKHRARYDRVWHEAAGEEDTIQFIKRQIKELERGNTDTAAGKQSHRSVAAKTGDGPPASGPSRCPAPGNVHATDHHQQRSKHVHHNERARPGPARLRTLCRSHQERAAVRQRIRGGNSGHRDRRCVRSRPDPCSGPGGRRLRRDHGGCVDRCGHLRN